MLDCRLRTPSKGGAQRASHRRAQRATGLAGVGAGRSLRERMGSADHPSRFCVRCSGHHYAITSTSGSACPARQRIVREGFASRRTLRRCAGTGSTFEYVHSAKLGSVNMARVVIRSFYTLAVFLAPRLWRTTCCRRMVPLQGRNRSWRNRVVRTASLLKHSGLTHPRIGCCFYGQRACCTQSCGRLFVMIAKAVCRSRKNKNFYDQRH